MTARVLVIDDDVSVRLLCRTSLAAEGIEVLESGDGLAGVQAARLTAPDLILLDVTMSPVDGWRVADTLREDPSTASIPIVFMLTEAELRHRPADVDTAAVRYIRKPFNPGDLSPVIRRALG